MTTQTAPSPTWNGADYIRHPRLTLVQRMRGLLRVAGLLAITLLALALFLLGKWLQRLWSGVTFQYGVARWWAMIMLRLLGVRRAQTGAPLAGAGVMVANHASWGDILAIRAARRINFVAKAEVRGWAGIGWIAAVTDTVFISRRRSAARTQAEVLRKRLIRGETLCIFAEGTSSDGQRVLPFKSALLSAVSDLGHERALAVQPVTVNWIAPPDQPPAFYGWWGTMGFEAHIWQVACRSVGGAVEVVFHPPHTVDEFTDRKALTRWCEDCVRAAKKP
jgi:1-acyl-sn-glycerol-3-phosphate acyltransferase